MSSCLYVLRQYEVMQCETYKRSCVLHRVREARTGIPLRQTATANRLWAHSKGLLHTRATKSWCRT